MTNRLFNLKDYHILIYGFESAEGELSALKMQHTDFLERLENMFFVPEKVRVVAAVDSISIYNLTAEKCSCWVRI